MPLFCRSLCVGCLAATLAPWTPAEALPSEITLESWLRSGEPRLVAWGAHRADPENFQLALPRQVVLLTLLTPIVSKGSSAAVVALL
jgi:hypothetical protein